MTETAREENIIESEQVAQTAKGITDEKFKRTVIAVTVGAVLLLCVLIILMSYQLIKINAERNKKAELNAKIAEAERLLNDGEKELEYLRTKSAIERLARELGYHYADDIS